MALDELIITRAIVDRWQKKFLQSLETDVSIVGGGPAGLVAGYCLASWGHHVALFERKLSIGGGMWGGGMMFNEIVVQEEACELLKELGITAELYEPGYYCVDSILCVATLTARACQAGLRIWNLMSVEDVMMQEQRVTGIVVNWTAVEMAQLHVDPLTVKARFSIDASGHACELVHVIQRKVPGRLLTPSGSVEGEQSLWAEKAERLTLENTKEVFPGVYVAGMSANAAFGGPRMGPIFGGMLLSGKKVAQEIHRRLLAGEH
jgi:thiamine thiazole synthase